MTNEKEIRNAIGEEMKKQDAMETFEIIRNDSVFDLNLKDKKEEKSDIENEKNVRIFIG